MRGLLIRFWIGPALLTAGLVLWPVVAPATPVADETSAVVLMYHRFGESGLPSTNTTVTQLEDHIAALKEGGHPVVPLADVVSALRGETTLPPRAVAITVDDAYRSFLTTGWPRFKAAGYPVTLFVATDSVSAGYGGSLTWDEIRALQQDGVTLGAHSHGHGHFPALSADAAAQDLEDMKAAFEAALGDVPPLFAYPYGEAGLADMAMVQEAGFLAAFGQHSGVAGLAANPFYLPRFALNESYGGADRFRLIINTLPLPVAAVSPAEPVLVQNPPPITLTLAARPTNLSALTCFGPTGQPLLPTIEDTRILLSSNDPFPVGRVRFNCTLPAADPALRGRWHWFGWQMIAGFKTEGVAVHPRYR